MTQTLIILDRDGVINEDSDDYIKSVEEWSPISGSIDAIARLSQAGFTVVVVTNQSGVARGLFDEITLANMHSYMCFLVEEAGGKIDAVFFCPHSPDDNCACRKPRIGMLDQVEKEFSTSVEGAFLIGDSAKDIEVALAKHCRPVLVRTGKGLSTEANLSANALTDLLIADNLKQAVDFILN